MDGFRLKPNGVAAAPEHDRAQPISVQTCRTSFAVRLNLPLSLSVFRIHLGFDLHPLLHRQFDPVPREFVRI